MTEHELTDKINAIVDKASKELTAKIPGAEKQIFGKIIKLSGQLKTDRNDNIVQSVENIKVINLIVAEVGNIVRDGSYGTAVSEYAANMYEIQDLQHEYFATIKKNFKPTEFLKELQKKTIADTMQTLSGDPVISKIKQQVNQILTTNTTSGASFGDYVDGLRSSIVTRDGSEGIIKSHAKTYVTDALNQYSRGYENVIAGNLGLTWGLYSGGLIKSSRAFCEACVKRLYIHISEIPLLLKGDFPEFEALDGKLNPDTGLPEGMYDYENAANFTNLLGGYGCRHRWIWVSEDRVPAIYKNRIL